MHRVEESFDHFLSLNINPMRYILANRLIRYREAALLCVINHPVYCLLLFQNPEIILGLPNGTQVVLLGPIPARDGPE